MVFKGVRALVNISSVPHSLLANVSLNVLKIFLIAYLAPNTCSASRSKDSDEDDCLLLDITANLVNGLAFTYFLVILIFDLAHLFCYCDLSNTSESEKLFHEMNE